MELKHSKGIDRAAHTILTFEGLQEMEMVCDYLLNKGTFTSMRTRMDFMLSLNMLLRGQDRRQAEFPEIFRILCLNEGVGSNNNISALCLRLTKGKVSITFEFI